MNEKMVFKFVPEATSTATINISVKFLASFSPQQLSGWMD